MILGRWTLKSIFSDEHEGFDEPSQDDIAAHNLSRVPVPKLIFHTLRCSMA